MPAIAPIHEAIDTLQVRLYKLTTRSHLHIGAGEGSLSLSTADKPLIQALFYTPPKNAGDAGEQKRILYLPGSSLHGVIRAWAEKIRRSNKPFLTPEQVKAAVGEVPESQRKALVDRALMEITNLNGYPPEGDELYEHWRVHPDVCDPLSLLDQCQRFGQASEVQNVPFKHEWLKQLKISHGRQNPCPICQVFGYMGQRGRVRVHNAYPATGELSIDVITRVAINRISGAADEGKLFDVEAIPPGAVFYFYVVMENMNEEQRKTFDAGVRALQLQLATLGAHSTVGFGLVELRLVVEANIKPSLFNRAGLLEEIKAETARLRLRGQAAAMDTERYPSFYNALCMINSLNNKPPTFFGSDVTVSTGDK